MTYYRVVPTKPDRPLTSIVFPKSGSSYFRKVGLPETKDELERAIVERFVEVCRVRGGELQHEGRPAEPGDALLIDGNGENVHLQLVEVVDIRRIRTNLARRCCMKTLWGGGALLVTLRRSHTTGMKSKVHPTYKTKYRVANWPAYNQALVRRGDVTVWLSSEAIAAWTPRRSGRRGGQRRYSDLAIETALTLRLLYHLPLRQAEGFLHALFGMMRLDLSAPDYTTLSRRSQHLTRRLRPVPTDEGIHLVLDSTGLSIVGEGEWAAAKHGGRGRRGWRKLHLGVDQSGVIRVHTLTEETGDDATTALDLLTAVEGPLVRVTADAAYDTVAVYETAGARGATVVVPPARTANASGHGPRSPARDRTITLVKTLGRRHWKKASGYHRQSRVENTFFRYKSIIGDGLRARSPAGQGSEVGGRVLSSNACTQIDEEPEKDYPYAADHAKATRPASGSGDASMRC